MRGGQSSGPYEAVNEIFVRFLKLRLARAGIVIARPETSNCNEAELFCLVPPSDFAASWQAMWGGLQSAQTPQDQCAASNRIAMRPVLRASLADWKKSAPHCPRTLAAGSVRPSFVSFSVRALHKTFRLAFDSGASDENDFPRDRLARNHYWSPFAWLRRKAFSRRVSNGTANAQLERNPQGEASASALRVR